LAYEKPTCEMGVEAFTKTEQHAKPALQEKTAIADELRLATVGR
jgi:hypothetical protein